MQLHSAFNYNIRVFLVLALHQTTCHLGTVKSSAPTENGKKIVATQ